MSNTTQGFLGRADGRLRNPDHRFEWTRNEFSAWAHHVSLSFGYQMRIEGVRPTDPLGGSPTQMGVFIRGFAPWRPHHSTTELALSRLPTPIRCFLTELFGEKSGQRLEGYRWDADLSKCGSSRRRSVSLS